MGQGWLRGGWWMIVFIVIACFFALTTSVASYLCVRFMRKTLQLDEIIDYMQDDLNTNLKYLEDLLQRPVFMNTPEIVEFCRNMEIMRLRLTEIIAQAQEHTKRQD